MAEGMNNDSKGGATAATGKERRASIERSIGTEMATEGLDNKTRSPHNSAGGPNYCYEDVPGEGFGGNVNR
jgi:hypothetical protein